MTTLDLRPTTTFRGPANRFAAGPPESRGLRRDGVRLLVAEEAGVRHVRFADLPDQLRSGDLVVVNTSATVHGQLYATLLRGTGPTPVVLHVGAALDNGTRVIELRTAPHAARPVLDASAGDRLSVRGADLALLAPYPDPGGSPTGEGNRLWRARVDGDLAGVLRRRGRPISYGYLDGHYPLSAYQSVFSTEPGSAEMPSAGRPFTDAVITRLVARGIGVAPVTLHTGLSSQEAGEAPQPEWYAVPAATARAVESTRAAGGRVVAVGTTVTPGARVGGRAGRAGACGRRVDDPRGDPR